MEQALSYLVQLGRKLREGEFPDDKIRMAGLVNPWFIPAFARFSLQAIATVMLDENNLREWLSRYPLQRKDKTIGLIFAGNLPLVGFHDFLCAYAAGCRLKIKLSSKDEVLFPALLELLQNIDPELSEWVEIVSTLKNFDAVIATGSSNTNRYFEYYFRDYPKLLRGNRNGVAVLTGTESDEQLRQLADDIFLYFGFGCRNVAKLYVPVGYDFTRLFPQFEHYRWLHDHTKYMHNYDYHRTMLLMNNTPHFSNDFVMLTESEQIASPIAMLHYEYWHDENVLATKLKHQHDQIQCIVSSFPGKWHGVSEAAFGQAQHPALADYADGVDTLRFLLEL